MGVSLFSIQLEIDDSSPHIDISMSESNEKSEGSYPSSVKPKVTAAEAKKLRGKRSLNAVSVETHRRQSAGPSATEVIPFFSGNPFVEKTQGLLHIYKLNASEQAQKMNSKTLCILSVPAVLSSHDLLQFLAPFGPGLTLIRIIRDNTPNQYMVLITFHEQAQCDEFYCIYNGKPFNTLEPDLICHLVYVSKIETKRQSEGAGFPMEGHTELPTCPVCLEKMDESVDGILTVLCNHSFHASCLNQWGDTSCPVCRYIQTPELTPDHKCFVCGKQEDLWICLICGNIGCGRYAEAHAVSHFKETQHTFSLEVGGQRVWDYAGDNYVHRLIQSKSDGKVVEFDNAEEMHSEEKLDGITLEYTYLLTNQLESQRLYFEEKVANVEKMAAAEVENLERRVIELDGELHNLKNDFKKCISEKSTLEKKLQQANNKLAKSQLELKEEKDINQMLRRDQSDWTKKTSELEKRLEDISHSRQKEIGELQEQLRDLMFHFEAQTKLEEVATSDSTVANGEEIREGHLMVGEAPTSTQTKRKGRKKK